jgi:hypothetical protein
MEYPSSEDSYVDKEQMKPMRKVLMLAHRANYLSFNILIMNFIMGR